MGPQEEGCLQWPKVIWGSDSGSGHPQTYLPSTEGIGVLELL